MTNPDRNDGRGYNAKDNIATSRALVLGSLIVASSGLADIIVSSTRKGRKAELEAYQGRRLVGRSRLKNVFSKKFPDGLKVGGSIGRTNLIVEEEGPADARRARASYGPGELARRRLKSGAELIMTDGKPVIIPHGETRTLGTTGIEISYEDPTKNPAE